MAWCGVDVKLSSHVLAIRPDRVGSWVTSWVGGGGHVKRSTGPDADRWRGPVDVRFGRARYGAEQTGTTRSNAALT